MERLLFLQFYGTHVSSAPWRAGRYCCAYLPCFSLLPSFLLENIKPLSLDHIHLELLAAFTGFTGFLWLHSLYICMRDSLLFGYFFIGPGAVPIVSVLFFLPLALLFLGECLLVMRRFLLGSVKQTSLLYGMAEKWREATPLEKRLARKNLWSFLFILAGVGCCIWVAFDAVGSVYFLFIIAGSAIILVAAAKGLIHNRIYKDLGRLIQQINEMAKRRSEYFCFLSGKFRTLSGVTISSGNPFQPEIHSGKANEI